MISTMQKTALHVVLVEPEIPWNTGNAGRTCLAAGARLHLIEPLGFSLEDRAVRRAGLDYWPNVRPCIWPSWACFEAELAKLGTPRFFAPDGDTLYWDVTYPEPSVLIFGSETKGFPAEIVQVYGGSTVRVPQTDSEVRSLNLSTTVALGVYEARRQHRRRSADRRGRPAG